MWVLLNFVLQAKTFYNRLGSGCMYQGLIAIIMYPWQKATSNRNSIALALASYPPPPCQFGNGNEGVNNRE